MPTRAVSRVLFAACLAAALPGSPAAAQGRDFLFQPPSVTVGVRAGYAIPRASSEIFDFTREQLTVDRSDLNGFAVAGELNFRTTDRIDIALNLGGEWSRTRSEFREFVGTDDLPIAQETKFTRAPLTVGVKAYLLERGRRVSRLAWVPRKWAPYVGAGGGLEWYRFEQKGEFVDFETFDIFFDEFESSGVAPLAYVEGGVDLSMSAHWLLTGGLRYSWASAGMDEDFVGFDDIDLSGLRIMAGVAVRP